jgi:hypothetical protein
VAGAPRHRAHAARSERSGGHLRGDHRHRRPACVGRAASGSSGALRRQLRAPLHRRGSTRGSPSRSTFCSSGTIEETTGRWPWTCSMPSVRMRRRSRQTWAGTRESRPTPQRTQGASSFATFEHERSGVRVAADLRQCVIRRHPAEGRTCRRGTMTLHAGTPTRADQSRTIDSQPEA